MQGCYFIRPRPGGQAGVKTKRRCRGRISWTTERGEGQRERGSQERPLLSEGAEQGGDAPPSRLPLSCTPPLFPLSSPPPISPPVGGTYLEAGRQRRRGIRVHCDDEEGLEKAHDEHNDTCKEKRERVIETIKNKPVFIAYNVYTNSLLRELVGEGKEL